MAWRRCGPLSPEPGHHPTERVGRLDLTGGRAAVHPESTHVVQVLARTAFVSVHVYIAPALELVRLIQTVGSQVDDQHHELIRQPKPHHQQQQFQGWLGLEVEEGSDGQRDDASGNGL